ncbi:MAG TPA: hypothetical protein VGD26_00305 [Chitinophagaceae bacterium]
MEQLIFEELLKACPEEASMNLAESILDACLEAGMLPPKIEVRHGFLGDEYGMTNEWDDET